MRLLTILFLLIFPVFVFGQHNHSSQTETNPVVLDDGLGDVNHPVSTKNAEAQKFFNQGLAYIYAFNHEEAIHSFKRAAELDADLAMAYWGASLALGSNYNLQADAAQLKNAYANLQKALQLAPKASPAERDYIAALAKRYSSDPNADRQKLAQAYKTAMGELSRKYPNDSDAATLYAESMMNLRPWQLWSLNGKPAEGTLEIVAVLESVLKRNPNHTGANHYYIHAVEASPNPERAVESANRLRSLAPNAGHLVHMPSHIYIRTGDYTEAAKSNADAIVADRRYIQKTGAAGVYTMMYFNHNIHFLAAASAMNGNYAEAIKNARLLESNVRPHVKMMPMLEMFTPYPLVTLARFQKWEEILKYPEADAEMNITNAFRHFARGIAFAETGKTIEAEKEFAAMQAKIKAVTPDAPFGNSTAQMVLKVAEEMLAGEIALAKGDKKTAIDFLRKAVAAEDVVNYNEPPDWDLPAREWLGKALLKHGEYAEAAKVYRAELVKHPRNGRALFGLAEALRKQNKSAESQKIQGEFEKAWEKSDTRLAAEDFYQSPDKMAQIWKFGDVLLETGIKMRYAEQGEAGGVPVILLHGFADSSFSWSRVLPLLDKKFHVFALDQRGHGETDKPQKNYAMKDFAADVVAFMDAKNIRRAIIVGHSMGSFVALQTTLDAPERVEKLAIIGTATTARNEVTLDLQKSFNALNDPIDEKFVREFQVGASSETVPVEFMNQVVRESLKPPARVWQSAFSGVLAEDYKARLGKIKVPTLIVWGEKENLFLRDQQDLLKAGISNASLKVYSETGHSPNWEKPERLAKDLNEFINNSNLNARKN